MNDLWYIQWKFVILKTFCRHTQTRTNDDTRIYPMLHAQWQTQTYTQDDTPNTQGDTNTLTMTYTNTHITHTTHKTQNHKNTKAQKPRGRLHMYEHKCAYTKVLMYKIHHFL